MASLRCHGDSDCNKTQIIRNYHFYSEAPAREARQRSFMDKKIW